VKDTKTWKTWIQDGVTIVLTLRLCCLHYIQLEIYSQELKLEGFTNHCKGGSIENARGLIALTIMKAGELGEEQASKGTWTI